MKKFILTVGPSLLNEVPLSGIHDETHIYRINGAHGYTSEIEKTILQIRNQVPNASILMDLPGNKIRTKNLPGEGISLKKGELFEISNQCFNYPDFYKHLKEGMTAWANDSIFEFEIVKVTSDKIVFLSKSDGFLKNNKGIHVRGIHDQIPFLLEKDMELIRIANQYCLTYVGLSFVRNAHNITEAIEQISPEISIISKIETMDAVKNLNDILPLVKYILIDRGDLSTDIGIEKIPRFQKFIIEKALYFDTKIFLATQLLKNMEDHPIPTIAEIESLYEIYKSGIYGVQMSEETAVGKYVKECICILKQMNEEVLKEKINL